MREIRFRAWDIKRKKWISTCNIVMSLHGKEFYWNFGYEPLKNINQDEFILSQFAGLKDKNGKEIYEGDIVRHEREITLPGDFETGKPSPENRTIIRIGSVKISPNGVILSGTKTETYESDEKNKIESKWNGKLTCYKEFAEVIGNKFENQQDDSGGANVATKEDTVLSTFPADINKTNEGGNKNE